MGHFRNGKYVPVDTGDNDLLADIKYGGGILLSVAVLVASVVLLIVSLLQ